MVHGLSDRADKGVIWYRVSGHVIPGINRSGWKNSDRRCACGCCKKVTNIYYVVRRAASVFKISSCQRGKLRVSCGSFFKVSETDTFTTHFILDLTLWQGASSAWLVWDKNLFQNTVFIHRTFSEKRNHGLFFLKTQKGFSLG